MRFRIVVRSLCRCLRMRAESRRLCPAPTCCSARARRTHYFALPPSVVLTWCVGRRCASCRVSLIGLGQSRSHEYVLRIREPEAVCELALKFYRFWDAESAIHVLRVAASRCKELPALYNSLRRCVCAWFVSCAARHVTRRAPLLCAARSGA